MSKVPKDSRTPNGEAMKELWRLQKENARLLEEAKRRDRAYDALHNQTVSNLPGPKVSVPASVEIELLNARCERLGKAIVRWVRADRAWTLARGRGFEVQEEMDQATYALHLIADEIAGEGK